MDLDEYGDPFAQPRQSEITKIESVSCSRSYERTNFWDDKLIHKCLEIQVNHSSNSKQN